MAPFIESFAYAPFDETDPDDFRPHSKWAVLVDPWDGDGSGVDNITVIFEEIAGGDRIPLHVHPSHEVIVIAEGDAEVTLGGQLGLWIAEPWSSSRPKHLMERGTLAARPPASTRCFARSRSGSNISSAIQHLERRATHLNHAS